MWSIGDIIKWSVKENNWKRMQKTILRVFTDFLRILTLWTHNIQGNHGMFSRFLFLKMLVKKSIHIWFWKWTKSFDITMFIRVKKSILWQTLPSLFLMTKQRFRGISLIKSFDFDQKSRKFTKLYLKSFDGRIPFCSLLSEVAKNFNLKRKIVSTTSKLSIPWDLF